MADSPTDTNRRFVAATLTNCGEASARLREVSKAEAYFRDALKLRRELAAASFAVDDDWSGLGATCSKVGEVWLDLGRYEEAEAAWREQLRAQEELARRHPDSTACSGPVWDIRNSILGLLETAVSKNPNSANWQGKLRAMYVLQDRFEEAIQLFDVAIEHQPTNQSLWTGRGTAWLDLGNSDKAIGDLTQAAKLKPNCAPAYTNRGRAYAEKGDLDAAIRDLSEAIRLDSASAIAYADRGFAYDTKGDLTKAQADWKEALRFQPKCASQFVRRAQTAYRLGIPDRAAIHYRHALRLDPNSAFAHAGLGRVLFDKKSLDAAVKEYDEAIRLLPKFIVAYAGRGYAYEAMGQAERAKADFKEAYDGWAACHSDLGCEYRIQGRLDKAMAEFTRAIRTDPESDFISLGCRASLHIGQGNLDAGVADFNRMVRLRNFRELIRSNTELHRSNIEISKEDLLRAMHHPLATGQSTFAAKAAQIVDKDPIRRFVWRDSSGGWCDPGYVYLAGYEREQHLRNPPEGWLAVGVARVRDKWEPGLLLMAILPAFEWKASWPQGTRLKVRYALNDVGVTRTGCAKFSIIAVEDSGKEHVLGEQTLKRGDKTVYDRNWTLDYRVAKIRFLYDEPVGPRWEPLWVLPEVELPK